MGTPRSLLALLTLALIATSCRNSTLPSIDPSMAACIPGDTRAVAGFQLEALRSSPIYSTLPPSTASFLQPLQTATDLLLAFNGTGFLVVARGQFHDPPPGATLLDTHLMLAGSPASIQAAVAQHKKGSPGPPDLLTRASSVAPNHQIWIVARGSASLPLAGNGENLNRFLQLTEYATLTARIGDQFEIEARGECRTEDAARHLEESLRAFLSLAAAGVARRPPIADLIRSIRLRRDDLVVRVTLAAPADAAGRLLQLLAE